MKGEIRPLGWGRTQSDRCPYQKDNRAQTGTEGSPPADREVAAVCRPREGASAETHTADTSVSDFQPPERWENHASPSGRPVCDASQQPQQANTGRQPSVPTTAQPSRRSARKGASTPSGSHTWLVISRGSGSKRGQLGWRAFFMEARQEELPVGSCTCFQECRRKPDTTLARQRDQPEGAAPGLLPRCLPPPPLRPAGSRHGEAVTRHTYLAVSGAASLT